MAKKNRVCPHCGYECSRPYHLKVHIERKHPEQLQSNDQRSSSQPVSNNPVNTVPPQIVNPVSSSNDSQNHTVSPVSTIPSQSTSSQQNRPSQTNNNTPEQSTSSHFFKRNPVKKQTLFPENSDSDTSDDTFDDDGISSTNLHATKLYSELRSSQMKSNAEFTLPVSSKQSEIKETHLLEEFQSLQDDQKSRVNSPSSTSEITIGEGLVCPKCMKTWPQGSKKQVLERHLQRKYPCKPKKCNSFQTCESNKGKETIKDHSSESTKDISYSYKMGKQTETTINTLLQEGIIKICEKCNELKLIKKPCTCISLTVLNSVSCALPIENPNGNPIPSEDSKNQGK